MYETRSAYVVLNRCAPKTVPGVAEMSRVWLRELPGQEPEFQGRHAIPKFEVRVVVEITDEVEEPVLYEGPRPVKQSTRNYLI